VSQCYVEQIQHITKVKTERSLNTNPHVSSFLYMYNLTVIKTNILFITAPNKQKLRRLLQHLLYLSYVFVMKATRASVKIKRIRVSCHCQLLFPGLN
jgi:hypothetical protein